MADAQELLDSYDASSKPLPAKASTENLQPSATVAPAQSAAPAQVLPSVPAVQPVAPINVPNTSPMLTSFESSQGQNFGHPMTAPTIPKYELNVHVPETPKEAPSLWEKMIAPVGSFAQGLGGGALHTADTAEAALETPFRLAAQGANVKQEAAPGMEEAYEEQLGKENTQNPAYQLGKGVGSLGGYVAQGALMPESLPLAGRLGSMAVEGGYLSGAETAKEQLKQSGKINPGELAGSMATGAGIATGLGAAGMGVKALAKHMKAKEMLKGKIASAGRVASEEAGEPIEAFRAKMKENLSRETRRFEHDQLNRLWNHLREQPERNPLQKAQRQALEKVKARQEARLTEAKALGEPEPQGAFRLTKRGKGYEAIEYATDLKDLQKELTPKTYKNLKDATEAIANALSWKKHFENEVEVTAKHALGLAKTAAQKAKVLAEEETRLTSGARNTIAKAKSELYTKQQQALKAKTQALHDELIDELKAAPKKRHAELRAQISQLDEALQRLNTPEEVFNIPKEKHLYAIANRSGIQSSEVPQKLEPTFGKAYKQFVEATNNLKAASRQYEMLSKHFLPAFEDAEAELQSKGDKLARLWVKASISHPYSRKATTEMAVGTQHNPHMTYLHGVFAQELDQIEREIRANDENLVKEIAYKIGGVERLTQQSGKQAFDTLKKLGALHPSLDKIALAVALGLPALDNPSSAEDGTPQEKSRFFGNVSMAMIGAILAAKYGPAAARRLVKNPDFFYMRAWANTRDLAGLADKVMGLNPFSNPNECMGRQLVQLQGKVIEALFHAPDDHEYLMKAAFKEIDGKLLSAKGKKYAQELYDMGKTFKGFVSNYVKEFDKVYNAKTPDEQAYLKPVRDAVHFVHGAISPNGGRNLADTFAAKIFVNAARAWFSANPLQFIANFFDVAIGGPLKIGPVATAQGYKSYLTNPILRGMVDKVVISGPRSAAMQQAVTKGTKNLWAENLQARIMSLGSFKHYFDVHQREMKAIGISKWEDFASKLMSDQVPADTKANAFIQLGVDLVDTIGHDPLSATKGPMSRSPMGFLMQFVSQPERYSRLLVNNVMQGNIKWIAASLGVLWQVGGHAALPKSLAVAGWLFQPEDQAKMQAVLDMTSIGQQVFGDMSRKVDWDPLLYPAMGVEAPGFEQILELIGDLPKVRSQLASVVQAAGEGGGAFMDSKYNPEADKAQTALRSLINDLSLAYPTLGPIPLQAISAALYYLPDVKSGATKVGIQSPYGIGNAKPMESPELKSWPGATQAAVRGMLRLGAPEDVTLYRTAKTGLKLGNESEALEKLQEKSGIY
jgi:hypothetical protein